MNMKKIALILLSIATHPLFSCLKFHETDAKYYTPTAAAQNHINHGCKTIPVLDKDLCDHEEKVLKNATTETLKLNALIGKIVTTHLDSPPAVFAAVVDDIFGSDTTPNQSVQKDESELSETYMQTFSLNSQPQPRQTRGSSVTLPDGQQITCQPIKRSRSLSDSLRRAQKFEKQMRGSHITEKEMAQIRAALSGKKNNHNKTLSKKDA